MPITPYHLDVISRIAAAVLNSLLSGIGIALVAWTVTRVFGLRGSGTRFAVWFIALIAIAALPWVGHSGASVGNLASGASSNVVEFPPSLALYLVLVWVTGAIFGLIRIGVSLFRIRKLRSACAVIDPNQLDSTLQPTLTEAQAHRRLEICTSSSVRVPAAIGYFRPAVVFPEWALREIPSAELNAIMAHELAHLRRWDDWTNLVQKIVKSIFFFHPAVWFIDSRLSLEREMACDDAVLAANFSPRTYAESLIGLAEKSFLRRGVQLAQAAVSHVHQLKMRIAQILRKDRQGSAGIWKPAAAMMSIAAMVVVYSVSRAPSLVMFNSAAPQEAPATAYAHAVSLPEALLHPVKANFVAPAYQTNESKRPASAARYRLTRRVALRPSAALVKRTKQYRSVEENFIAPPMIVLTNFPVQSAAVAPAVLVVMQGKQLGVDGPIFWQLTFIQLPQSQQRIVTGGVPRKI